MRRRPAAGNTPQSALDQAGASSIRGSLGNRTRLEIAGTPEHALALVALLIGLFWAIGDVDYAHPQPSVVILFLVGLALGAVLLAGQWIASWGVLVWTVAIGISDRFAQIAFNGSDVVGATMEAIHVLTTGGNPYAHTYTQTRPPGSPFPYLPGEIAWYGLLQQLTGHVVGADKLAGMGIVVLLAALAIAAGPARAALGTVLYAGFQPAILRSLDGSNDTSLAFLILVAVVLLVVWRRSSLTVLFYASAFMFGWALLFKSFTWLIYPFVVNHLRRRSEPWRRYAAIGIGLAALVCFPFAVTAPGGFARNVLAGLSFHRRPFGLDLWVVLRHTGIEHAGIQVAPVLVVVAVLITGIVFLRYPTEDLGGALFQGSGVVLVSLFFARYATSSYYTFVFAVLAAALILWLPGASSGGATRLHLRPVTQNDVGQGVGSDASSNARTSPYVSSPGQAIEDRGEEGG